MNSRGANFKTNTLHIPSDNIPPFTETFHPPKTPLKRPPPDTQNSIFPNLSPLPLPPKIDGRATDHPFNIKNEMKLVETPLPK